MEALIPEPSPNNIRKWASVYLFPTAEAMYQVKYILVLSRGTSNSAYCLLCAAYLFYQSQSSTRMHVEVYKLHGYLVKTEY